MASFLSLLLLCTSEESQAKLTYLYRTYQNDLMRHAKNRLRSSGDSNWSLDAQDIVQNTFLRATKVASRIDMNHNTKSYLFAILSNEIIKFLQEWVNQPEIIPIDDPDLLSYSDTFVDDLNLQEEYDRVMAAIDKLKEIYKITFIFRFKYQMKVEDIAAAFDIPVKTVYTRLCRGREALLKLLDKEENQNG